MSLLRNPVLALSLADVELLAALPGLHCLRLGLADTPAPPRVLQALRRRLPALEV
jgi:hypothetical protein